MMCKYYGMFLLLLSVCFKSTAAPMGDHWLDVEERVTVVMEKVEGLDVTSLDALCRHYGFSYSQGMCNNDEASVPVKRLVEVAACHYPVLGDIFSKRRNEVAELKKLCGKNCGKLKSKIATRAKFDAKLSGCSKSLKPLYQKALDNAESALSAVEHSLRKVEKMDRQLAEELSYIIRRRGGKMAVSRVRTDVSIVKGEGGYRLSVSPQNPSTSEH